MIARQKARPIVRLACAGALCGIPLTPVSMQAAVHFQSLKSFGTVTNDGQSPLAAVVVGSDGVLYGTTSSGGISNAGTVFRLNSDGNGYRTLYSFGYSEGGDSTPLVLEGSDGILYGTTPSGGSNQWGTIFKLGRDASGYSLLHTFLGYFGGDGGGPNGLVEGRDGVLYGTTLAGGSNNWGTVFRMNKDGSGYRLLHCFGDTGGDGEFPYAGVVDGGDGALYGTTHDGGSTNLGTVFKLNTNGTGYIILHNYYWGSDTNLDGYNPTAPLLMGSDGVLYGTTYKGGGLGKGTVFKLNRDGSGYRVLQSFGVFNSGLDGLFPWGGLVEGSDGALYGTTLYGGTNGVGTLYRFTRDGRVFETLYQFHSALKADGQNPWAGLAKSSDGALYGTTAKGGAMGVGVVFRLWPPQTPDMIGVTIAASAAYVIFSGSSGYSYQILRSTNLTDWTVLGAITMPSQGVYTNVDNAPPSPAAYYRAAWIP